MSTEPEKPLSEVEKGPDKNPHFASGNDETLLNDKLKFWRDEVSWLKPRLDEATERVKFYEKAIKDYDKAFKKLQKPEK